ncbi:DUF3800 domain-containing protein [Rothia sp. P6271]|uniref:DUF3800 domain-containing protein n=1 Tax=Rothia sp. P6271 TaxID=3402659 RepID=UPI003AC3C6EE
MQFHHHHHHYYCENEKKFQYCDGPPHKKCQNQLDSKNSEIFAFIDESERAQTHYFMGAIVASAPQIKEIATAMDSIMEEFSQSIQMLTPQTEFHGSEMMNGHGVWADVPLRIKIAMFHKVFKAIQVAGARVFVEGIHYAALNPVANKNLHPRERAFSHLFEQINYYGSPQKPLRVIADEHHTAETSRSNLSRYMDQGTYGYKPNRLTGINPNLIFSSSTDERMLQASDMATYIYNRLTTVQESNSKATQAKRDLWDIFDHNPYTPDVGRGRIWPPKP